MLPSPRPSLAALTAAVLLAVPLTAQTTDAGQLLAAVRTALGGPVALDAVRSFTASGSLMRDLGRVSTDGNVEIIYESPDRFAIRETRTNGGGGPISSWQTITRSGVNGDQEFFEQLSPGAPFPIPAPPVQPQTPAEAAAAAARRLRLKKREMTRYLVPLFGVGPASYPVALVHIGQRPIAGVVVDVIEVRDGADVAFTMYVDSKTHLPVLLSWMALPIVTFSQSTSTTMAVSSRGGAPISPPPPPMSLPPDPTAGLAPVEHEMAIAEYRTTDGLTWPMRWTHRIAGKIFEDARIRRIRLNQKIDPNVFKVTK